MTLTVTSSGEGAVRVDGGRTCDYGCQYREGAEVTLQADYDETTTTLDWEGADCAEASCRIVVDQDTSITARFTRKQYTLTVASDGSGGVRECGGSASCTLRRPAGHDVSLTAMPAEGQRLAGWDGCTPDGELTCQVTMDGDRTVTARFQPRRVTLTVATVGDGGTVTVIGRACGAGCTFDWGTPVTLEADYDPDTTTVSWSDAGVACSEASCSVTLRQDMAVTATFSSVFIEGATLRAPARPPAATPRSVSPR